MNYLTLLISFNLISAVTMACSWQSGFIEMHYQIDSSNSQIIHIELITTDTWCCTNGLDSARLFIGNGIIGSHLNIPLVDTMNVEDGYILKTYKGDLLFDTMSSDSVIYISYSTPHRHSGVVNFQGSSSMLVEMNINYKGGGLRAGIVSPKFNGTRIANGVVNDTFRYNPFVSYTLGDSIVISLQSESGVGIYFSPPNTYHAQFPNDTILVDGSLGTMVWLYPRGTGYYDILYQINHYHNGHYIGYIQRDMLLYIFPDTTTGVSSVSGNAISNISVSPNPSHDRLYLHSLPQDAILTISDMTGRICTVRAEENEIDVSTLPAGMYYLHIQSPDASIVRRFVKE